jgi:hypothetical protein
MKTGFRLTIAAFGLAILTNSTVVVQAQFNYIHNNGTVTIERHSGPGGDVTIPSTFNGLPVMSIGDGAFSECVSLTSVYFEGNVPSDGWSVFDCDYSATDH